jgi:hypothetical protein
VFICLWGAIMPTSLKKNLNHNFGSFTFLRMKEAARHREVDVLFLGSSHAYRGFDTRIFKNAGFNTFNLGSSSQTPIQTLILLDRYLDRLNPKMILYEVYPDIFSIDGIESALDLVSNDRNDIGTVKMAFKLNHIKVYNTLIYSIFRDVSGKNAAYEGETIQGDDAYVPGGYVEKKLKYFKNTSHLKKRWQFNERQFRCFEKIRALAQKRGIRLVLVQAPVTNSLYRSYANNDVFDERMRRYGAYYNFNEPSEMNDSLHYYDADHLNQLGVAIFNKNIIEKIFVDVRN